MAPKRKRKDSVLSPPLPAPVDIFVPESSEYDVIEDTAIPAYSAMLNQTNLANNNNKFFLIQALVRKDGTGFASWFRWGRVGYSGQTNLQVFGSRAEAVQTFTTKFEAKTLHEWGPKIHEKFKPVPGKYTLLAVESLTESIDDTPGKPIEMAEIKYKRTALYQELYDLIKLISSRETFERELRVAGIDLNRMPLGKISAPMLKQAYKILKQIETELLGMHRRSILVELSNQFYTLIPHNFGFTKGMHYVIDSFSVMREKADLLESLQQAKENSELKHAEIKREEILRENPIDDNFSKIQKQLDLVPHDSPEFQLISQYKELTQGSTHSTRTKIRNIFKIQQKDEPNSKKIKHLLWHGSRLTNWFSILSHGLKVAPPEAPHTGYMFDKGIYTTDCFSKCAQYCFNTAGQRGLVVLCEVELGKSLELFQADYDASKKLGKAFQSVKGVGNWFPDPSGHIVGQDGVIVPVGKLVEKSDETPKPAKNGRRSNRLVTPPSGLLYNEYIVYNPDQVRMKYIVELEFGRG
jgi:poly [ADP-ribose] polymerase 2/3/4